MLTGISNDLGFQNVFSEQLKNYLRSKKINKYDNLICLSSSGNSENVINAIRIAKKMEISVYGFLGNGGGKSLKLCDHVFLVPSKITGRIQEAHITAGHALMEYVEDRLIEIGHIKLQNHD